MFAMLRLRATTIPVVQYLVTRHRPCAVGDASCKATISNNQPTTRGGQHLPKEVIRHIPEVILEVIL